MYKSDTIRTMKKQPDIKALSTLLKLQIRGDGTELFDYSLPLTGSYQRASEQRYTLEYLIDGVFWTKQSAKFLNDVLLRFNLSMQIERIDVSIVAKKKETISLKEFSSSSNLKSLSRTTFQIRANKHEDSVFWGLKLFVEHYIKESDFIAYDTLFNYAYTHYYDHVKDYSTLKAKCLSIWNWYYDRDFKSDAYIRKYTDEELKMSRQEHMKKVNEKRKDEAYKKVVNAITGLMSKDYKKKSGAWHISNIAKDLNIDRRTVSKYIKKYESEAFTI